MKTLIILLALKGFITLAALCHRRPGWAFPQPGGAVHYFTQGLEWAKKREWTKAITAYNRALELSPRYVEAFLKRGLAYLQKDEYDQVISDFSRAIELRPDLVDAYVLRGLVYCEQKRYRQAAADFLKVSKLNPAAYAGIHSAVTAEFPQLELRQPSKKRIERKAAVAAEMLLTAT